MAKKQKLVEEQITLEDAIALLENTPGEGLTTPVSFDYWNGPANRLSGHVFKPRSAVPLVKEYFTPFIPGSGAYMTVLHEAYLLPSTDAPVDYVEHVLKIDLGNELPPLQKGDRVIRDSPVKSATVRFSTPVYLASQAEQAKQLSSCLR